MIQVLLIGNPNCGKTTLFNALTGSNQRVGNWAGVTVEKKTGQIKLENDVVEIIDLPGVYSLVANAEGLSQDEQVAANALTSIDADCIINVIDACHMERHLYLTSQLLELGKPVILAINMMDIAKQRCINLDINKLSQELACPVVALQAHKKVGVSDLLHNLKKLPEAAKSLDLNLSSYARDSLIAVKQKLIHQGYTQSHAYYFALRLAEGDGLLTFNEEFEHSLGHDSTLDIELADARYQKIHECVSRVQTRACDASEHFTAKLDKIILNRFLGIPIFLAVMYLMFLFAINIGGALQDFFDISTDTVFVKGSAWLLHQVHAPNWLLALISNGIGKGMNTTLTFIPVIACMYLFLSFLETSGYMARAAFVVDKAMRAMGLPGKSFVPMIVGFGCNVPSVMAARTLDSERDRLLTILMSPFMSCSARLTIYAVFVAAFFPSGGHNIVFSLYLVGILMAVLTGFILRKTYFKGKSSPLILELPAYHKPTCKRLFKETLLRLRIFLFRAGRMIMPVCVILGVLNAIIISGTSDVNSESLLTMAAKWVTPLFAPMGIHQDNWPATVGLMSGLMAKEVVIGTLNSLYSQMGHLAEASAAQFDFWAGMKEALWSIPNNFSHLGSAIWNPIMATADDSEVSQSVFGIMANQFDGQVGAYAYLLFILLYVPCISTMAVIREEANRLVMWTSIVWSLVVAYTVAVLFYQIARIVEHPQQSIIWIVVMLLSIAAFITMVRFTPLNLGGRNVATHS